MACLTSSVSFDIFFNYFTFFCLLTHLGVNNIRATGGDKQLHKKGTCPLSTAYIKQKSSVNLTVVG